MQYLVMLTQLVQTSTSVEYPTIVFVADVNDEDELRGALVQRMRAAQEQGIFKAGIKITQQVAEIDHVIAINPTVSLTK
jgi:hypothetical protein